MKRLAVLALALAFAGLALRPSAFSRTSQLSAASPPAAVWDSVYTDSQTVRGDSLYQATCVKCHAANFGGGPDGNPLTGPDFMANWNGLTLDQIYDKIRNEMPPDNPKTIPPDLVPDVMALILSKNGFPSGKQALPNDVEKLKTIKFEKARP